ncbi:DUF58 domain-containing protein [Paracoccaceae bacterium]
MIQPADLRANLGADLRARAEALGQSLPALLAEADQLARAVQLGAHGRRRAGQGDEFWQYRPAHTGDAARSIDWRRSARSDAHFVREREWQAAQSVTLWVDRARSMGFSGDASRPAKGDRARLLALALAVLLLRGGERVGLAAGDPPRPGRAQLVPLLTQLADNGPEDFGVPLAAGLVPHGRAVFISDFLGPLPPLEEALAEATERGVRGALLQVLDPAEEEFPFGGRVIFASMGGTLAHETQSAGDLRARYLDRLAERKARLAELARAAGWHFSTHHSGQPAQGALLWLYQALEGGR